MNTEMYDKIAHDQGFLAALDQSGGSTPKALAAYGIGEGEYDTDVQMFDLVHDMRTRIMTSPSFTGERILGAILFEGTMDREVAGIPTPQYLWDTKEVVPFVKVDKGLEDPDRGVQLMKPIDGLTDLLERVRGLDVFGTKMRSVIKLANADGVADAVAQQFRIGHEILAAGLMPILEPEVDITSPEKQAAEEQLLDGIMTHLDDLPEGRQVMLKLSIPTIDGFYSELMADPRVLRVVALSGGYSREEANERLGRNAGLVASFSRALLEDLSAQQSDEEFDACLDASIDAIYRASVS